MLMQGLTNGLIIGRDFFQLHVKSIHFESKELEMRNVNTTGNVKNIPYLSCINLRTELRGGREDSFEEVEQYKGGPKILIEKKPESEIDRLLCGLTATEENDLKELIAEFKDIFSEEEKIGTCTKYVHQFKVKGNFVLQGRPFTISQKDFPAVNKEVKGWLENGTVRTSDSPHRVPLVIVKKASGKVR